MNTAILNSGVSLSGTPVAASRASGASGSADTASPQQRSDFAALVSANRSLIRAKLSQSPQRSPDQMFEPAASRVGSGATAVANVDPVDGSVNVTDDMRTNEFAEKPAELHARNQSQQRSQADAGLQSRSRVEGVAKSEPTSAGQVVEQTNGDDSDVGDARTYVKEGEFGSHSLVRSTRGDLAQADRTILPAQQAMRSAETRAEGLQRSNVLRTSNRPLADEMAAILKAGVKDAVTAGSGAQAVAAGAGEARSRDGAARASRSSETLPRSTEESPVPAAQVAKKAFDEMVRSIRASHNGEVSTADIELDPPRLGRMTVAMHMVGDALRVSVKTQSDQARKLLQNRADELRSVMELAGIRVDEFSVALDEGVPSKAEAAMSARERSRVDTRVDGRERSEPVSRRRSPISRGSKS